MNKYLLIIYLLIVSNPVFADRVHLENSGISFEAPSGFKPLTGEILKIKFPRGNPPKWVYSNDDASVTVAIKPSKIAITYDQLDELLGAMEQQLPRGIPNLVWLKKEVSEFNKVPWMHLELTSTALDADIHNHMYMTAHRGMLLAFNFNSTKKQYEKSLLSR